MTMEPHELLHRLASTLRNDVAPAVDDEYTRTQAHMSAVILTKLSRQLALGPAHAAAERADIEGLVGDLAGPLATAPPEVTAAAATMADDATVASLGPLIGAIHRWGLEHHAAGEALQRIRAVLRNDIDRRLEIAR